MPDPVKKTPWLMSGADTQIGKLERRLMNVSNLAGLYYPTERTGTGYYIEAGRDEGEEPVPPEHLRHSYGVVDGKHSTERYLQSGVLDTTSLRAAVTADGFDLTGGPMLEFGCSSARMLRNFRAEAQSVECWGADIHADAIHWAQANLSPPFHFVLTTTAPHLPFEDNYFNLVFAGSVFTHIGELDDVWLLELRRITRRGGRLYLTVSDENTLEVIKRRSPKHPSIKLVDEINAATGVFEKPWLQFVTRTTPWLQRNVYCRERWLAKISRWFNVVTYKQQAYGWQSAVLLEKR